MIVAVLGVSMVIRFKSAIIVGVFTGHIESGQPVPTREN